MQDTQTLKTIMQALGKTDPKLKSVLNFLEWNDALTKGEKQPDEVLTLAIGELNPRFRPLLALVKANVSKPQKDESEPFVQYNRPQ